MDRLSDYRDPELRTFVASLDVIDLKPKDHGLTAADLEGLTVDRFGEFFGDVQEAVLAGLHRAATVVREVPRQLVRI